MATNRKRSQGAEDMRQAEKEVGKNMPKGAVGEGDGDV